MLTSTIEKTEPTTSTQSAGDSRALKILAKSVYRELRTTGHTRSDIVAFTNALLELVTDDIRESQ